jgi:hypothetical protein
MATDEMGISERASLALFLDTLRCHAQPMAAIIGSYSSPSELIADSKKHDLPDAATNIHSRILETTAPIFESEIDLAVDVDPESASLMRRRIEEGSRRGQTMEARRIMRIATFAGEVATWQAEQEMYEHTEEVYPGVIPRQGMTPVVFMEPSAAEAV